jgi:hypothetical protein
MGCSIAFSVILLIGMIIRSKDIGAFGANLGIFMLAALFSNMGTAMIADDDSGCFASIMGLLFIAMGLAYLAPLVVFLITGEWPLYMLEAFPELVQ